MFQVASRVKPSLPANNLKPKDILRNQRFLDARLHWRNRPMVLFCSFLKYSQWSLTNRVMWNRRESTRDTRPPLTGRDPASDSPSAGAGDTWSAAPCEQLFQGGLWWPACPLWTRYLWLQILAHYSTNTRDAEPLCLHSPSMCDFRRHDISVFSCRAISTAQLKESCAQTPVLRRSCVSRYSR